MEAIVKIRMSEEEVKMVYESLNFITSKIKKAEGYQKLTDDFLRINNMITEKKQRAEFEENKRRSAESDKEQA